MSSVVQHAPRFTEQESMHIANDLFGLNVIAKQLPSERDQNFHLTTSTGKEYVLKLANAVERFQVLDFQNQAMRYITQNRTLFASLILSK